MKQKRKSKKLINYCQTTSYTQRYELVCLEMPILPCVPIHHFTFFFQYLKRIPPNWKSFIYCGALVESAFIQWFINAEIVGVLCVFLDFLEDNHVACSHVGIVQ